ncbi:Uncharacterised protein [Yokenella regensburgei]|nr:Uncharacterised protein [Yokenella regensburgei]
MLRLLTDVSENHGEFIGEADEYLYASVPIDCMSEINTYVFRDVNAENPFIATDRFVAEMKAQGVDMAIEHLTSKFIATGNIGVPLMSLEWLAKQLREAIEELKK